MDASIANLLSHAGVSSAAGIESMSDLQTRSTQGQDKSKALEKMQEVGEQFEAVFLSMMIKEMRKSIDGDGLFAGDSGDAYGGMFDMFIGEHLSESQPLGIGDMLVEQLTRQHAAALESDHEVTAGVLPAESTSSNDSADAINTNPNRSNLFPASIDSTVTRSAGAVPPHTLSAYVTESRSIPATSSYSVDV